MNHRKKLKRSDRVNETLRKELSNLLMRGTLRDPRVEGVVVSAVKVTEDLSQARVYVRLLQDAAPHEREALIEALEGGAGILRRAIAPAIRAKNIPELRFYWDDSVDHGLRMEAIFHELAEERQRRELSDDDADEGDEDATTQGDHEVEG
ncbi:MAG: 30S ribosome-binding factor RbfA [Sandaracinaceae bacterium]|nr:30S ribosome-binding factor RbfA [Sandaracinaceae bacterium]